MGYAIGAVLSGSATDPCCCGGGDCCIYGWPDPDGIDGGPFYPDTDLPDSVVATIAGTPFTLPRVGYNFELNDAGDIYLLEAQLDDTFWILRKNGDPRGTNACLIGDYDTNTVEDEFLDTYTVTFTFGGLDFEIPVDRLNNCEWQGSNESGSALVYYDSATYKWNIQILGTSVKDDPQSSPDGSYADAAGVTNILVSP